MQSDVVSAAADRVIAAYVRLTATMKRACDDLDRWMDARKRAKTEVAAVHDWWRVTTGASFLSCLSLECQQGRDVMHLMEVIPDSANGNALVWAHRPAERVRFFADRNWVAKTLRIGRLHETPPSVSFAARACVEASATDYVGRHKGYDGDSFGLVHEGTAYVVILRRRLQVQSLSAHQAAQFFYDLAAGTLVGHNDPHAFNMGWNALTGGWEPLDMERAILYEPGDAPPLQFLCRYALAVEHKTDDRARCMNELRGKGLNAVYTFYMDKWCEGANGFSGAYDAVMFQGAPKGRWSASGR